MKNLVHLLSGDIRVQISNSAALTVSNQTISVKQSDVVCALVNSVCRDLFPDYQSGECIPYVNKDGDIEQEVETVTSHSSWSKSIVKTKPTTRELEILTALQVLLRHATTE